MSRTKAITTSAWSCSKPTSAACLLLPTADVGNNKRKNFHAAETFASASLHRGHCLIKRKGPCILHQIIQPFYPYICVLLDHKKLERLTKLKQTYLKIFFLRKQWRQILWQNPLGQMESELVFMAIFHSLSPTLVRGCSMLIPFSEILASHLTLDFLGKLRFRKCNTCICYFSLGRYLKGHKSIVYFRVFSKVFFFFAIVCLLVRPYMV